MTKGLRRRLAAAAIAAVASFGCSSYAQAGKIRIGFTTWVGYGPLFLARDLGYFKDNGVDVELKIIEEGSMTMAAVAGGDLEGSATTVDELMKYRSDELCFKYVLALDESHGGDGVIADKSINSVADLKGKQVAFNEGSVSEFWIDVLLKKAGMTESDITVTNMTADDAAAAFIAGRVPAAVTWEPHLTEVRKQDKGKVLVNSSTTPGLIVDVVSLKCDVIKNQASDVTGLRQSLLQSHRVHESEPRQGCRNHGQGRGWLSRETG